MEKNIELFCVAHKPPPVQLPHGTKIIGVSGFVGGDYVDSQGQNEISAKNPRFCELTAIYWLIHNHHFTGTHTGICHYRRLWSNDALLPSKAKYGDEYIVQQSKYDCQPFVASLAEMAQQLSSENSQMLMPSSVGLPESVFAHYQLAHDQADLILAFNTAIQKGYLTQSFAQYFLSQASMYPYNMGILPTEYFVQIWQKVLDVLLSIEAQIPEKQEVYQNRQMPMLRSAVYQNRVFGFLAERLYSAMVMADLWQANPVLRLSTRAVMMIV